VTRDDLRGGTTITTARSSAKKTKQDVRRRENKCRKNIVVGDGSLRPPILYGSERRRLKYLRREGLEWTLENKPEALLEGERMENGGV